MSYPQIVAHRGSAADRPENALSSFITAAASGAEQIELDVHMSSDGQLVVMHDAMLEQTSLGHGAISSHTLAELQQIKLRGMDETIPTLAQVLDAVGSRIHTRIEIKKGPDEYVGLTEAIMGEVESRGLKERVTIMCFQLASIQPFAKAGYATSLSFSKSFGSEKDLQSLVRHLGDDGIADIGFFFHELDQQAIDTITEAGLTVGAWTVNGAPRLDYWLRQPISYILTDQADLALSIRARL
jgi:glycerophosphoryl diester phosphodiesterase